MIIIFNLELYFSLVLIIREIFYEIPRSIVEYNYQTYSLIIVINYYIGAVILMSILLYFIKSLSIISLYPIFEILNFLGV